MNVFMISI
jgi:hypothetical protein